MSRWNDFSKCIAIYLNFVYLLYILASIIQIESSVLFENETHKPEIYLG